MSILDQYNRKVAELASVRTTIIQWAMIRARRKADVTLGGWSNQLNTVEKTVTFTDRRERNGMYSKRQVVVDLTDLLEGT